MAGGGGWRGVPRWQLPRGPQRRDIPVQGHATAQPGVQDQDQPAADSVRNGRWCKLFECLCAHHNYAKCFFILWLAIIAIVGLGCASI